MQYQAQWGPKGFVCSPVEVLPLMDLSTSKAVKSETQSDANGTGQTSTKGLEPTSIKFSMICLRAAGVDPRQQIEEWEALLGDAYPLYIENKCFGPKKLCLKSVNTSEYLLSNSGKILKVKIDLDFVEYEEPVITSTTTKYGDNRDNEKDKALSCRAGPGYRADLSRSVVMVI